MSTTAEPPGPPASRLNRQKLAGLLVLLLCLAALLAGAIAIFLPFAAPIVIATVVTILAVPLFQWILRCVGTERRALASGLTCGLLLLAVLGPLAGLGWYVSTSFPAARKQLHGAVNDLQAWTKRPDFLAGTWFAEYAAAIQAGGSRALEPLLPLLRERSDAEPPVPDAVPPADTEPTDTEPAAQPKDSKPGGGKPKGELMPILQDAWGWFQRLAAPLGTVFTAFVQFFLVLFILFFFLKDGKQILEAIQSRIPLERSQQDAVIGAFKQVTRSVVRGSILTAGAQGLIATVGYAILGLPVVILGPLTTVAALVPPLGTGLIMVPVALGQGLIYGSWGKAIFLFVLCGVVGALDNILKPMLLREGGLRVHSIWLLLAILGGIDVFGPMGFLYGPLVLVLLGTFVALFVGGSSAGPGTRGTSVAASPASAPPPAAP